MTSTRQQSFGRLRSLFWPVYAGELRLILPMVLMSFLICMNYTLLRNMKDALVVTANAGAEVLPFIKVWVMLPVALLMTYSFTKLCNRYSQEKVFYIIIGSFLSFYAIFLVVLYPLQDYLHPHAFADKLAEILPIGCKGFIDMIRNWTFTALYVMSELWSVMILTVLFWGLANEITKVEDSTRLYSLFNVSSNLGSIVAGQLPWLVVNSSQSDAIKMLLSLVLASGLLTMVIFRWMNKNVLSGPEFESLHVTRTQQRTTRKPLGLWESFAYVARSSYLFYVAALVVGYNLVVHVTEVLWKDSLQHLYPAFNDYNVYLGGLTTTISLVSMCMAFGIPKLLKKCGWTFTALVTPVLMSCTCGFFFLFLLVPNSPAFLGSILFGISPLAVLVVTGAMQNISSRSCKYSFFDATKEMLFIPLDHEFKLKGKAAIDGVGSRLGKSGGSCLILFLLLTCGSLAESIPYLGVILFIVFGLWIYSVRALGIEFNKMTGGSYQEPAKEELPEDPVASPQMNASIVVQGNAALV